ncbi:MAG: preprotein translocase subunit YajC [Roseibacillus sp.]|jgi:preprotein translocase subunit YajC|nr:preprotein translocase subunit YajC [Roseibacillus sp.]MDP7308597.1 preprotein translocase subunit YajC [Roseibacillus sp.]MDP7495910.1 preprotein translocase subunit YajC [Roseibacillus sp.]HJM63821.1 preprotein translocase subunit YajC [Roseibacillus sp.]|tara:strand:- start:1653 stop:2033 length:381 start_codon:yes stop_codon:yes gene_type:complete
MKFYSIIAADPPTGEASQNPMGSMWVMLILMFVIMYFLILRPQSKAKKEQAQRVSSLEKGDKIVTIGGLHGAVHHISKTTVTVKLSEGVFVPFEKDAIRSVAKVGKGGKKEREEETGEEESADDKE